MTPPFLLDTSALLAHFANEPGRELVAQILEQNPDGVYTSAVAWFEFRVGVKEMIPDAAVRSEILDLYEQLLTDCLPVTRETSDAAFEIREATPSRLPNSDALIAATARMKGATLIHRDPHFQAIPSALLAQVALPESSSG